jgi:hypothetical protein
VVHDDAQPGCEASGLGRPVPDDGGRRDHERGPVAHAREEVGQHRRRLAEPHVEREAAAEAGRVEEAEPRERLGLVTAEDADEARRHSRRFRFRSLRGFEEFRSPPTAFERDTAGER